MYNGTLPQLMVDVRIYLDKKYTNTVETLKTDALG